MSMHICFLFGHSDCPAEVLPQLVASVEYHYTQYGVRQFYVGNRGNFDRLTATALRQLKKQHPNAELYLLLAYHPSERRVNLPEDFDGSFYPPIDAVPKPYRIVRANRYMVDIADSIICYVNRIGNSRELLCYAQRGLSEKRIDNIAAKEQNLIGK